MRDEAPRKGRPTRMTVIIVIVIAIAVTITRITAITIRIDFVMRREGAMLRDGIPTEEVLLGGRTTL